MRGVRQLGGDGAPLSDMNAFDWNGHTRKIDANHSAEFKLKCGVFIKLLSKYRALSLKNSAARASPPRKRSSRGYSGEGSYSHCWWGEVFEILKAKGLEGVYDTNVGRTWKALDEYHNSFSDSHNQCFEDGTD